MNKYKLFCFAIFLFSLNRLVAEQIETPFSVIDFGQQNKSSPLLPTTESDQGTIVAGCVNVVTGHYIDSNIDLSVDGLEPLTIQRSYHSKSDGTFYYPPFLEGGPNAYLWYINSNTILLVDTKKGSWAGLCENGGGTFSYQCKGRSPHYMFDFYANKGVTNTGSGLLSGQTNFKNSAINLNGQNGFIEVRSGDGSCRFYKATSFSPRYIDLGVNFLQLEQRPSGNRIIYEYNQEGRLVECKSMTPHSQKIFSKLTYQWMDDRGFTITGEEGRTVRYLLRKITTRGKAPATVIDKVIYPNGLEVKYFYNNGEENPYFCTGKEYTGKRTLRVEYYHTGHNKVGDVDVWLKKDDDRLHKVKLLAAPVGPNDQLQITHRFFYYKNMTEVLDAESNRTRISYDEEKRVTGIEKFYKNGSRFSYERNLWGKGENVGNLMAKIFEDETGKPYFARVFEYDSKGNVVVEKLLGNLSGENADSLKYLPSGMIDESSSECALKSYTYTDDGFNLLRSEDDGTKITFYGYVPQTNLLASKLISDRKKIKVREFRFYNEDSALIKKVIDDGSSTEYDNLIDVTERKITLFEARKTGPSLGLPERVEERYLDLTTGEERVLKTYVNHYNGLGKIDEQIVYDAHGKIAFREINTYDIMGRVVEEIDALNQKTTYTYDLNGNLTKKSGAFDTVYVYDYADRLVSETIIDPSGEKQITRYAYDLNNNRILQQDYLGNETKYTYDEFHRLIQITLPPCLNEKGEWISKTHLKKYDVANHLIEERESEGNTTQIKYNIRGQVVEKKTLGNSPERFLYDLQGRLIKAISKKGVTTSYDYDYLNRLLEKKVVNSKGEIVGYESYEYDAFHLRKKNDINGLTHHFFYDGAGREMRMVSGERKLTKDYDSLGRISAIHQHVNHEAKISHCFLYDQKDRVIEEFIDSEKGTEKRVRYIYDTYGNRSQEIHFPENQPAITTTIYDAFKRPRMVIDPLGHQTRYFYDETINEHNQRVAQRIIVNAEGTAIFQRLNALGIPDEIITKDPAGQLISKEQWVTNSQGQKIKEVIHVLGKEEPQEIVNSFSYQAGKLVEMVEDREKRTRYVYNNHGELVEMSSPRSKICYAYDEEGRVISKTAFSPYAPDDETLFEYNTSGQLVKIAHQGKETTRSYNLYGELIEETQESGYQLSYQYDSLGRKSFINLPDGSGIRYEYRGSLLNKVVRVDAAHQFCYEHTYIDFDWQGNVKESLAFNGLSITSFYDLLGRRVALKSELWKEAAIAYDAVGNIVKIIKQDSGGKINCHFSYNALSQLIRETGLSQNTYAYDSCHNRLQKNTNTYKIGPCNKLISTNGEQFEWDEEGNLLKRYGLEDITLSYDSLGHLSSYQQGDMAYHYSYDPFDRRISKNADGYSTIYYLYDGENEIGLIDEGGKILELRLLGIGEGAESGAAISIELEGLRYFPLHDQRGNVACLYDDQGNIVESYRYTAFGELTVVGSEGKLLEASKVENPWLFSSKRHDLESSLIYFGKRYYDAGLGRWITPDPKGFEDGSNLYAFVKNNPLAFRDFYGLKAENATSASSKNIFSAVWESVVRAVRGAGSAVEWVGKNLIPIPGIRDGVEAIGRWTAGGKLFQQAEYHSCNSKIIHIPGIRHETTDFLHINGVYNTELEAVETGMKLSIENGGYEQFIAYNSTHGLMTDFIECIAALIGIPSSPERVMWEFIKERPDRQIYLTAHSQGGLHVYNLARYLSSEERDRIEVKTYGSAKLIPRQKFNDVTNTVSMTDMVSLFSLFSYTFNLIGIQNDTVFVKPTYYNPIKEHVFLNETYFTKAVFLLKQRGKR